MQNMAEPEATKDRIPVNQLLTLEQRDHLEELFRHIVSNASVDYTNKEIQDINTAVCTMLERIRTRVNSRGVFNIARVIPAGSMAEQTSLWRIYGPYGVKPYLEFDFLAQLENSVKQCGEQITKNNCPSNCRRRINCQGCIKIVNSPVELDRLRQYCNRKDILNTEALINRTVISDLFVKEINYCLTSACDCLTLKCKDGDDGDYIKISLLPSSVEHQPGCGECTVDMPTGTLHVNTQITIGRLGPNKCSLIFQWVSKKKTLLAPDLLLLQKPQPISSLPIFVDFLPVLESLKPTSSGAGEEHDYFIVPKRCNVCGGADAGDENDYFTVPDFDDDDVDDNDADDDYDDDDERWRKSWCMAELKAFTTEMSDKHRRCYQIMKYFSEFTDLPSYHIKTVVLRHHTTCSDKTDVFVDCVIKMYIDLLQAYKTNELLSYCSDINILEGKEALMSKKACVRHINELCSVSVTDTWDNFIQGVNTV